MDALGSGLGGRYPSAMHKHAFALSLLAALAVAPTVAAAEVPKDPAGLKGISPYAEDLAKGREAFKAKDHGSALTAFDAAIAKDGDKMLAYLLKAQTQLDKGDLEGAWQTVVAGKAKKGTEGEVAKMLFLSANIEERRTDVPPPGVDGAKAVAASAWNLVKEAWTGYSTFLTTHTGVPSYVASADDRKAKVDDRIKRDADYGAVKERIDKNAADADKERQKDAAKGD